MSDQRIKGRIGLFIVAIIWGSSFVFSAISLEYFSAYQVLALRFSLAFLLMVAFFFNKFKGIKKGIFKKGIILGVFLYLAFMFQTIGLVYTTPSKNAFITAFNVVLVPMITAIFTKEKLNMNSIIGALLSIVGIAVMSLEGVTRFNLGDFLTLICAVFFALQIVYTNEYAEKENIYALNTIQIGTAAILGILVALLKSDTLTTLNISRLGIISVLYLGGISTMLAFLLQTASQRYTTGPETAIVLSTEAVFGMFFSAIILHEHITFRMVLGSVLILIGVLTVQIKPNKKMELN